MENLDQSMIDDIVATAEEGSTESRLNKLEEEVTELKGSIKKLLLDIRETMNILENPFQSIQSIADTVGSNSKVQALQIIPPEYSEPAEKDDSKKEDETEESISDNGHEISISDTKSDSLINQTGYAGRVDRLPNKPFQELKNLLPIKQIDPLALYNIIEWTNEMLGRYDRETLVELVEVFEMVGYISDEIRDVVVKIIELIDKNNNLDRAIVDLYKLYNILNPEDASLDSKVLKLLLNNTK